MHAFGKIVMVMLQWILAIHCSLPQSNKTMTVIKQFVFNHFEVNTFIVWDETKNCIIIDAAMNTEAENKKMAGFISENNLKPVAILLTHAHIDHVAGLRFVCDTYQLPVTMHIDGKQFLQQSETYGTAMGFHTKTMNDLQIVSIQDGDKIVFGNSELEARYVPGHAAGSMVYVLRDRKVVFTGDVLFCQSIGRTDLPTGDYDLLIDKLNTCVLSLDNDYEVLPGHGPSTTILNEKLHNPFLK